MYDKIFRGLRISYHKKNDAIFYAGDKGDKFFIILEGECKVLVPRTEEEIDALYDLPLHKVKK